MKRIALPVMLTGLLGLVAVGTGTPAAGAEGGAVVTEAACLATDLSPNDDGSSSSVQLPFEMDFYGQRYEQLWVNNNGNVTFDGPLSEYTPFGLADTSSVIIAPFFADVDTRGAGSDVVRYGYGTTTYEGRPAFCVNWLDVGYYNSHFDKLNSFQLLLVDRSDRRAGDVDIVFNYDRVAWETGDASDGVGGLGGSSARVGFSNGTLATGTSFELPGSGVPGSFLDSNAATGLVGKSIGSPVPGRYVFEVRNGTPPPQKWVAMGDSYQAGVGTNDYYPESGECQRSPLAYAPLLAASGAIVSDLEFVACSGARTADLYDGRSGEPAQLDSIEGELGRDVALVTVGIGGNDMEFGGVLRNCILTNLFFETCEDEHRDATNERFETLAAAPGESGLTRLQQVYRDIRFEAYRAQTMVLNYPRFFREEGDGNGWGARCQGLRLSDQLWINDQIRRLDEAIVDAALTMGVRPVDLFDASIGRELCNPDDNETFINGLTRQNSFQDSFHPSRLGYQLIADRLLTAVLDEGVNRMMALADGPSRQELTIHPGETITVPFQVPAGAPSAGFSTSWPSGDVTMSLRSPSGRTLTRDSADADVLHELAPTQELFYVDAPESGEWTVELYGADVSGSGDVVTFSAHAARRPNQRPTAEFELSRDGHTVTVDGRASSDTDGSVSRYVWEFDDGTILEGPVVSHRYTEPGEYLVTLTVIDDRDGVGVATADSTVTISRYDFTGFEAPVAPAPTVNSVKAGRAVPLKFSLGGDQGLDVLAKDSPTSNRVDCDTGADLNDLSAAATSGASSLQYDPTTDLYTYVWKTSSDWAGQCRNLTVTFDDGSSATLKFGFR